MIEVKLSDERVWKFKDDLSVGEIKAVGDEPDPNDRKSISNYNEKLLCAFSHDPIITQEQLLKLPSLDYQKLMILVLEAYQQKVMDFRQALKNKRKN